MNTKTICPSRLEELYKEKIRVDLLKKLHLNNLHEVPSLKKIVIHVTSGKFSKDDKFVEQVSRDLYLISGQKPKKILAKCSISNFKLREGQLLSFLVTLQNYRMYHFFDKLINLILPRVRDFRGLSVKSFDKFGNYLLGIQNHTIFHEIDFDNVYKEYGMNIAIITTGNSVDNSTNLLKEFHFPFKSN